MSNLSSTAETDGGFFSFDNDRYQPFTTAIFQHFIHNKRIRLNIFVLNRLVLFCEGPTGRYRVGSSIFPENQNDIAHRLSPLEKEGSVRQRYQQLSFKSIISFKAIKIKIYV